MSQGWQPFTVDCCEVIVSSETERNRQNAVAVIFQVQANLSPKGNAPRTKLRQVTVLAEIRTQIS
jgi:hypothetical protein